MTEIKADQIEGALLMFDLALATIEGLRIEEHAQNVLALAIFTVADNGVYDLMDAIGRHALTEKQRVLFLERVQQFEALGTANIRDALCRYGCSPAPQRLAN